MRNWASIFFKQYKNPKNHMVTKLKTSFKIKKNKRSKKNYFL